MGPTDFQKRLWWAALTALAVVVIVGVVASAGWIVVSVIAFLQPVLTPLAIAGILAYLLEPAVQWLEKHRVRRAIGVSIIFMILVGCIAGILLWIIPAAWHQGSSFATQLPAYSQRAQSFVTSTLDQARRLGDLPILKKPDSPEEENDPLITYANQAIGEGIEWLQQKIPDIAAQAGGFAQRSLGGVLGAAGFLLSLILVPIFLFFFLLEAPKIKARWSDYVPMRSSPLKSEIVSLLTEINSYLVNFFRGQLTVSMIDGAITAIALLILGLDFALLIGLMVGILGLIPYAGVFISWIPAVLIAAFQFNDWRQPLIVTIIFLAVNNLDGMFIAPKIVGESVGLHPLTVIISVLVWSIVLGGLLGALLAVPLTATLKVVLTRYFWDRTPSRFSTA